MMGFIVLGVVLILGLAYMGIFNGLIAAKQKVREAWSGIDVQLKRRYDLIPNLISTVKGYAAHEKSVLENVTKARVDAIAVPNENVEAQSKAENFLSETLKSLFAVSENYPDLKASQNFLDLQNQLEETEDQISSSRRIYNGNATVLNIKIESFPSNLVAEMHNFQKADFFELDDSEKVVAQKATEVSF